MPVDPNTEFTHPELGLMRFDDGKPIPGFGPLKNATPQWLCRPDGWNSDFEILLPGNAQSPQAIDQAAAALRHRNQIEKEGKNLSTSSAYLLWIDLTEEPPIVAFVDDNDIYVIWKGRLDDEFRIKDFKQGSW
jgi:hypothetical protein